MQLQMAEWENATETVFEKIIRNKEPYLHPSKNFYKDVNGKYLVPEN